MAPPNGNPANQDPDSLRADLREFLGYRVLGESAALSVGEQSEGEGYIRSHVSMATPDGDRIFAFLLDPDTPGPHPAVIVHHQHHGQRHLGKSEVCGLAGDPRQAFGPALARLGFVVLAPDSICFEERRPGRQGTESAEDDGWLQHYNEMAYRLLRGDTLMHKVLSDSQTALLALRSLPSVDPERIGALGHSYGGNTVLFHTALDERIRFSCASGTAASYSERLQRGTGIEMAEVIPGFLQRFEIVDLLSCIAPRPLLVVSGQEDPYASDANRVVNRARSTYDANRAGGALVHHRFPGGHAVTQERFDLIVQWMEATATG